MWRRWGTGRRDVRGVRGVVVHLADKSERAGPGPGPPALAVSRKSEKKKHNTHGRKQDQHNQDTRQPRTDARPTVRTEGRRGRDKSWDPRAVTAILRPLPHSCLPRPSLQPQKLRGLPMILQACPWPSWVGQQSEPPLQDDPMSTRRSLGRNTPAGSPWGAHQVEPAR